MQEHHSLYQAQQKENKRKIGIEKILQILQKKHRSQGNEIS